MKRISYFLLALLTLTAAVSCGDTKQNTPTETQPKDQNTEAVTEEAEPSLLDDLGEKDFGGLTYTIFDCNSHPDLQVNIPGESMNGEVINDALLTRDTYLEEKYNISIEYFQEDNISKLGKAVAAGDDEWQMVITTLVTLGSQATSGNLANMCDMPYVDMSQKWWNPLMYENMRLFDTMYYSSSDIAPGIYQMPTCLFLNLKLYTDYDYDFDIFQSIIDGTWTVEQLKSMVKDMDNDLNMDNKWTVTDDFFGLAMHSGSTEAVLTMLIGAGVKMSHISSDGNNITMDLASDTQAQTVIEDMSELFITIDNGSADINDYSNVLFQGDRALFFVHKLESAAVHLRDMESDYLILPPPKYDEKQEAYYSFLSPHGSCFIALPQTVSGNEDYGFITEALARYSNQYVRPICYDLVYKQKDSRDPRTADVLDLLLDGMYVDYQSLYNFGTVNDSLVSVLYKDAPLVSTLEKRKAPVEKAIAKLVENWQPAD